MPLTDAHKNATSAVLSAISEQMKYGLPRRQQMIIFAPNKYKAAKIEAIAASMIPLNKHIKKGEKNIGICFKTLHKHSIHL